PKTWDAVTILNRRLARVTPVGDILATGLAMGTGVNTDRAADILSALILQKGDPIVRRGTNAVGLGNSAGEALSFYTSFADRSAQNYSWNALKGNSLDAFAEERAAMAIGYASDISRLYGKNPHLNLGVAQFPQFSDAATPLTYGSFSFPVVSKASHAVGATWEFLAYLTSRDGAALYAKDSGRAPLRRDVIAAGPHSGSASDDAVRDVFYRAALTAKNWPIPNDTAVARIFETMIDGILAKTISPNEALGRARQQIMNLFSAPQ
ncbi:MAG: extracellular solute-binding protein, partial [Candidatus Sungbacteria bacterium]|nr:extracellular solute-binding protein [Candidatus Sungbacteria bacterium]